MPKWKHSWLQGDEQTSRLPPTLARRGGRGLSFSFLSWRRDCLRPVDTRRGIKQREVNLMFQVSCILQDFTNIYSQVNACPPRTKTSKHLYLTDSSWRWMVVCIFGSLTRLTVPGKSKSVSNCNSTQTWVCVCYIWHPSLFMSVFCFSLS